MRRGDNGGVTSRPFVVNVAKLRRNPGSRRAEQVRGALPGLAVTGSAVLEHSEVVADLVLEGLAGSAVLAEGTVAAEWEGACRRCQEHIRGRVEVGVRELFEPQSDGQETYPLHGDQVDLEPLVRDAVVLELPQAPLCRESCQGLCPQCGANRNEIACTCETRVPDPRWAALDQLKEQ